VPAILGAWGGDIDAPEGRSPHSSDIGSLLSPSTQPQPPEFTAGLSSAICHLSSVICHRPVGGRAASGAGVRGTGPPIGNSAMGAGDRRAAEAGLHTPRTGPAPKDNQRSV